MAKKQLENQMSLFDFMVEDTVAAESEVAAAEPEIDNSAGNNTNHTKDANNTETATEEDAFDEIDSKKSVERTNEAGKKVKNKYNGQIYTVVAVTDGGLVVTDSSKCTFLMTENDLVEVEQLAEQIVLKSEKAFGSIKFIDYEIALSEEYYVKKVQRDLSARRDLS